MNLLGVSLWVSGIPLTGPQRFLLLLPLCLSVAIVYKVIRIENLRDVPVAVFALWATIVGGMYAVGVGLWLVFSLMVG